MALVGCSQFPGGMLFKGDGRNITGGGGTDHVGQGPTPAECFHQAC